MFEAAYRKRLDADLTRWQSEGVVTPSIADAIRTKLGPPPAGVNIPTVIAIVGALLIAAAFLTFVASNWDEIPRPLRFVTLLVGITIAYALGAWFDRAGRIYLADICVTVGSIVFGGAIALTGQMYHLGGDFAAGVLLWAGGALLAAVLTGSRGALAVALVVACFWSGMRAEEAREIHVPFTIFWLISAALAVIWNSAPARHLTALAALAWWVMVAFHYVKIFDFEPFAITAAGGALLFGAGLVMANVGEQNLRRFGATLSSYGILMFVVVLALIIVGFFRAAPHQIPQWVLICGIAGFVLAVIAAALSRSIGAAVAALGIGIGLALVAGVFGSLRPRNEPWLAYALILIAMLSLVVSGMLDDIRPRVVAGWIGLGTAIAAMTWLIGEGSLIKAAVFLAIAGAVAVGIAIALGRIKPKEKAA
jgi:uncharacterized membrane protein